MVQETGKTRIDQARSEMRRALVEMAKAGGLRHVAGSATPATGGAGKSTELPSRRSAPTGG